jgi:hypothetical protein
LGNDSPYKEKKDEEKKKAGSILPVFADKSILSKGEVNVWASLELFILRP